MIIPSARRSRVEPIPIPGVKVMVGVNVCVWIGAGIGFEAAVGIKVGVMAGVGVNVGPNNFPGPQVAVAKLMKITSKLNKKCFIYSEV
jgi:hypothetical protein